MDKLKEIAETVMHAARIAGEFIRKERKSFDSSKIESKGLHDLVSYVDKTSEKMLYKALSPIVPGAGFLGEEDISNKEGNSFKWIVDPLDGTSNFLHDLCPYAVSIALMEDNEIILGVIYEITRDEMFTAWKDGPAECNGKPIQISQSRKLGESMLATGFPYTDFLRLEPYLESMKDLMNTTRGIRRMGSSAADLAWVAMGRFDAFWEYGLHPWDVAAGALIVERAGGKVCDFSGENNYLFNGEIIASNPYIYPQFLKGLKEKFSEKTQSKHRE